MNGLIKNELIKVTKPTSFKVIAIILAVIVVATPLLLFFVDHLDDIFSSILVDDWYEEQRKDAEERGDVVNAAYWGYLADSESFIKNAPHNDGNWKSSFFYGYIRDGYMLEYGLSLIVDKNVSVATILNSGFPDLENLPNIVINDDGSIELYWKDYDVWDSDTPQIQTINDMSSEDIAKVYADVKAANEKYKKYVSDATVSLILEDELDDYKNSVSNIKLDLENQKELYNQNKSEGLFYSIKLTELKLKEAEDKYFYFNKYYKSMNSFQDWTYVSIDEVLSRIYSKLVAATPLPKELYEETIYPSQEVSDEQYNEYLKQAEKDYKEVENSLNYIKYSLDHNIAPKELIDDSTKSLWEHSLISYNSIFAIVGIIIASSIVAKEYSTGSIRLLLIRPKKRWKILASKYLTVVILLLIVGFANYFVSMIISLILSGAKDFAVNELLMIGTKLVEVPAFLAELIVLGRSFVTALFFASLAFMIAVLSRKSAVSIILSVILLTFTGTISVIVFLFGEFVENNFLIYTVLPYLDFTAFTFSPIQEYIMTGDLLGLLTSNAGMLAQGLKEWLGLIIMFVHVALFDFFSYLSFTKSEIKN